MRCLPTDPRRNHGRLLLAALVQLCHIGVTFAAPSIDEGALESLRRGIEDGRYAVVELEARGLLAEVESANGPDSVPAAHVIDVVVEALRAQGRGLEPETRQLAERALEIKEGVLPDEDPALATSLLNLGALLADTEEKERSATLLDRALVIRETASGENSPEVAEVLAVQGYLQLLQGKPGEARPILERSLEIRREALGADDPEVAASLHLLAYAHHFAGDGQRADELASQALEIRERALRPDHPAIGASAMALASLRLMRGVNEGVTPLLERAVEIRALTFGPAHPATLDARNNLAIQLTAEKSFDEAQAILEQSLEIIERTRNPEGEYALMTWQNLGDLFIKQGRNREARRCFERTLEIAEKLEASPAGLARHCHNLAVALKGMGEVDESGRLSARAVELMVQGYGPDHPNVATALNQLGNTLLDQGELVAARRAQERAVQIRERHVPANPGELAANRVNLAEVLWSLGDRESARSQFETALVVLEQTKGADSFPAAYTETQLGGLLVDMGEFEAAEMHLEGALARGAAGSLPRIALADLRQRQGDLDRASELHRQVLAEREQTHGPEHPDVGLSLVALANVDLEAGRAAAARSNAERALEILEPGLGATNPTVGTTRILLARSLWDTGQPSEALEAALAGDRVVREEVRLTVRSLSERIALRHAGERAKGLDLALSIAVETEDPGTLEPVWDAVIRSRAIVLDEMGSRHRGAGRSASPEIATLTEDLASARARLAHLVVAGPDEQHAERFRSEVENALREKEQAERALAEQSSPFRDRMAADRAGWDEISRSLPQESALVSFVLYDRFYPARAADGKPAVQPPAEPTRSYVALVLLAGAGRPSIVPLPVAAEIDALIEAWRTAASTKPPPARQARRRAEERYRSAGDALRRAVWDPVATRLRGARQVFIVPDGAIHLVNLGTLPVEGDRYLIETDLVPHVLSAERDLVTLRDRIHHGRGLLALGAPDFDAQPAPLEDAPSEITRRIHAEASATLLRGAAPECESFREARYSPLPASRDEVTEVGEMWRTSMADTGTAAAAVVELIGSNAQEEAFKLLAPGHRVLHVATHGFFLDGACSAALPNARGSGPEGRFAVGENPLLLSGLALAGFNRRGTATEDEDDGVLTAEEIASLDLSAVEWVVLSACETGLGAVRPGEGVLGLRRAFRVAGAGTTIMSLWAVQDDTARRWMGYLYRGRSDGLSTAESVRRAAIEMIEEGRAGRRGAHPFYWGAFVAEGDWK